jgi:general secretion pathway protein C
MVRRIFPILNLAVITVVAWAAVDTAYKVAVSRLAAPPPAVQEEGPAPLDQPAQARPLAGYQTVLDRDLFKTKVEKPPEKPPEEIDTQNIEETILKLKLMGTVAGHPDYAYAVIEDQTTRRQGLYQPGESVQGAVIMEIQHRMVVLRHGERLEKLSMDEEDRKAGKKSALAALGAPPPGRINLMRGMINEQMQNLNSLMTQARVKPHFEGGQPDGLAITRIQEGSLFTQLGLQDNDVITGVNDREIRSVADAMELYNNLKSADKVALQIKRNGTPQTIEYAFH